MAGKRFEAFWLRTRGWLAVGPGRQGVLSARFPEARCLTDGEDG